MKEVVTLQQFDDGLGIVLPDRVAARLEAQEGDVLYLVETKDGLLLTRSETFARAMELYEVGSRKYADALRQLAE